MGTSVGSSRMVITAYNNMFGDTKNNNMYGLWMGISEVFKILKYIRINGDGTIRMVMISIPLNAS
jgi:hypothetical protein